MTQNVTGKLCNTYMKIKTDLHKKLWWENLKEKEHFESLDIGGNIHMDNISSGGEGAGSCISCK